MRVEKKIYALAQVLLPAAADTRRGTRRSPSILVNLTSAFHPRSDEGSSDCVEVTLVAMAKATPSALDSAMSWGLEACERGATYDEAAQRVCDLLEGRVRALRAATDEALAALNEDSSATPHEAPHEAP
jgi:hypothetical protein